MIHVLSWGPVSKPVGAAGGVVPHAPIFHVFLRVLAPLPRLIPVLALAVFAMAGAEVAAAQSGRVVIGRMPVVYAAAVRPVAASGVIRVTRDPGGPLEARIREVEAIRRSGQRVEIHGTCRSSCTLYLGAGDVCVSRDARLGFHGPSTQFQGVPLPPAEFERWSRVMAAHYPEPLRRWFLREGRNQIAGIREIRGSALIRMGVPECP